MSTADLPGASLLANRYRLVERLGAGGMSVVWRGFDEVLGRQVAVKVLPPSASADPAFRRRLRAEAQAAARLAHPHITNVYDYGEASTADGEAMPYVVMELVDGESLAAVLARSQRLPWQQAVRVTADVAAGLAAAHARGIVHRDVTPSNVMLTATGAKVVDFGISALIGENDIDPDGSLLGTPAYLAPERLEGGQVSPATDVYAVGLLIYRTLIGQLPWDVGTTTALLRAHQYTEPEPMPPVEGLPAAVATLIAACLQKRPVDRPSSAELAHVLGTVAAGTPLVAAEVDAEWDGGENTTILPGSYPRTDWVPVPPPPSASDAPVSPVGGGPVPAVPVSELDVAVNGKPFAATPRGGRNSRFGSYPAPAAALLDEATGTLAAPPLRAAVGFPAPAPSASAAGIPASVTAPPRRWQRVSRRQRVVLAAAVAALTAGGLAWAISAAGSGEPEGDTRANAVVPTPVALTKCVVSYAVWSDDGDKFRAAITVANREARTLDDWSLWFLMPGDQVVAGARFDQQARQVTVRSASALGPQASETVEFTGSYRDSNAAPMVFELDGETCDTYVSPEPGAPSRPVEHLGNGTVRLGPVPTSSRPAPGISIDPNGVAVVVPVSPSGSTGTATTTGTADPDPDETKGGDDTGTDPDGETSSSASPTSTKTANPKPPGTDDLTSESATPSESSTSTPPTGTDADQDDADTDDSTDAATTS